jgi:methylenetetrahydrofolate reductase (NADPH)
VYQKAYVEFFVSPDKLSAIQAQLARHPSLSVYHVDSSGRGNVVTNLGDSSERGKSVTAVTWGVFPDKEILQPTIFDPETFLVWSKEAFELWTQAWASIYDDDSESSALLYEVRHLHRIFLLRG